MKKIAILLIISVLLACNQQKTTTQFASKSDSLSIDLLALKAANLLTKTQQIKVDEDPVYHQTKSYNCVPLKALLEAHSSLKQLKPEDYKVVFECEDGYKPEMNLVQLLNAKAYLAISDIDAPAGRDFSQILKDGHEMKAAPFYVVYEGIDPKDGTFKWPYNLVKIHFAPANENIAALMPKNTPDAMLGYEIFKNKCQTCHALNGIGGLMGPELNYPKNITEYWKEADLKAFIQNPAAYRNGVKMPKLEISPKDADDLVKYLSYMAGRKNIPKI
jgi:cytochrome c2